MFNDINDRHAAKLILIVAALILLWFWRRYQTKGLPSGGKIVFNTSLIGVALLSVFAYFEFGWMRYEQYMNPHDVYHYYMGAKYSPEHKYFDLYRTTLVADAELGRQYRQSTIRDLNTHSYESAAGVLARADSYRDAFTPARWEEFKKDTNYWRGVMPDYKWQRLLRDKGYNATPVWNGIARFVAERAHTENVWAMRLLTYFDLILLTMAFGGIWAVWGWRAMAFAVIFHGTNFFMAFVHIKGAFLRLDWVVALVLATLAIYRSHYKSAGILMAFAASTRVFPLLFVFGLGIKCAENGLRFLWGRWRKSDRATPLNLSYLQFFVAFGVALALLCGGSLLTDSGPELWKNFAEKISLHNGDISTNRAGFKYVFLGGEDNKAAAFEQGQTMWRLLLAGALLLCALLARRLRDWETVPFSFAPVFFLTAPTFYYFVVLLVPLLFYLPGIAQRSRMLGAMSLFVLSATGYLLSFKYDHHFQLFFLMSCGLLAYVGYSMVAALIGGTMNKKQLGGLGAFVVGLVVAILLGGGGVAAWRLAAAPAAPQETPAVNTPAATPQETPAATPVPPSATAEDSSGSAELVFVGDVMLSRNVAKSIVGTEKDFTFPFAGAAPYTQKADIAFANLECPVSGRGEKLPNKNYVFNAPPESVAGLVYAGFDLVSLANNHTLDYGTIALVDTEQHLDDAGILHFGVTEKETPQTPVKLTAKGITVGYLGYCDPVPRYSYAREFDAFDRGPAKGTREALARDIAALRPQVDILVVSMHWGIEYAQPNEHQIALGRFIIDSGADIVAGHHPHVQQDPEVYNGKLIIHSMGNFIFDQWSKDGVRDSRLYRVTVTKQGVTAADYVPMTIPRYLWQPTATGAPVPVIAAAK